MEHGLDAGERHAAVAWRAVGRLHRRAYTSLAAFGCASMLVAACGADVRIEPGAPDAYVVESGSGRILRVATDGSANRPQGPITGPCPTPVGSTEELAATPRADANLELLALSLEPERMTASSSTYERVVSDVAAIRALTPGLADIGYRSGYDGMSLYVQVSSIGAQSIAAGGYTAVGRQHRR